MFLASFVSDMQASGLSRIIAQTWIRSALAIIICFTVAGCGSGTKVTSSAVTPHALRGSSFGGQQPVVGASVQLYAVGQSGSGSRAQPLLSTPAVTDVHGDFDISVYTCPTPDTPVYLLATGGSSTTNGVMNPAIGLMAMAGACGALTDTTYINMNEVTTVGSIWPLAAYMSDPTALGSGAGDATFAEAIASVAEFVNATAGNSPGTPSSNSYFAQQSKLYSLADILGSCINSDGGSAGDGTACGSLFSLATPAYGPAPTDTVKAALLIAQSPYTNVDALFRLSPALNPFSPTLASAPPDWTLTLTTALAPPVFSLPSGTYSGPQVLSISTANPSAVVHYTLDGTQPNASSPVYAGPISLTSSVTVHAIAIQAGYQSAVASATLTIAAAHPPVRLAFLVQPTNIAAGAPFSPAIQVAEEDTNGDIVTSANTPVTLALSGSATLTGSLTVTPANGIATFSNMAVSSPGAGLALVATAPALGAATSNTFVATAPVLAFLLPSTAMNTGSTSTGTVTLSSASALPLSVTLTSSAPAFITVAPAVLVVPSGQMQASFTYTGLTSGSATLSAAAAGYGAASASVSVVDVAPVIQSTLFDMTVENFPYVTPTVRYGTARSWDAYPGLNWADDNQSPGSYYFTGVDQFIASNKAKGAQILFTLGRTPQWASSQPNAPGYDGPGECAPPANIANWDAWVTALAKHVGNNVQYWELWNEPQDINFYCGDMPTMVLLAQHASKIIKAVNPAAMILSPGTNGGPGPAWLQSFLSAGGGAYVDGIAFHGYQDAQAESVLGVIASYKAVMAANGIAGKPLWDTESSWAGFGNLGTPSIEQQVGFIAKDYLFHWSNGVSRFIWYAYDGGPTWGGLLTAGGTPSPAVTSYQQVYQWMVGASMTTPCSQSVSGVWTCGFTRPGGYQAEAIWISNSSLTMAVSPQFTEYRDLSGNVTPITGNTVAVGDQPILLETGPLP